MNSILPSSLLQRGRSTSPLIPEISRPPAPEQLQNAAPEGHKYHISIQNSILDGNVILMALGVCIPNLFRCIFVSSNPDPPPDCFHPPNGGENFPNNQCFTWCLGAWLGEGRLSATRVIETTAQRNSPRLRPRGFQQTVRSQKYA